ncbi:LOW QUALITY PROTEIN: hypothetical protein BC936DRAFT_140176 [Jimgerdemannia flammicorona]|uniref:Fe2OG dioxygenase domain-containing protein n=1 Tax=Jimgerdemannia flammicorona TaxID=994334 RepID=A0A433AXI1_9FUNG|nr:LOW QUALITY PROTEIN: hypothetical protein BC936DRAFT_140176 [Jimgerdemannia flammicorona]
MPMEEKQRFAIGKDNFGYTAMHQEVGILFFLYVSHRPVRPTFISSSLDRSTQKIGDFKESYQVGKFKNGKPVHPLPTLFEERVDELESFMKSCHTVISKILQTFAIGLEIPESEGGKNWLSDRHAYDIPSGDVLRILHYPAVESRDVDDIRAGSHTDYGSVTLLFQHNIGGLEVHAGRSRWIPAPVLPGCAIINLGDCLEYWTNGLFKSTRHRVVFRSDTQKLERYSLVYFCQGYEGVSLDPIPSSLVPHDEKEEEAGRPLTAVEHLRMKLDASYEYYANEE